MFISNLKAIINPIFEILGIRSLFIHYFLDLSQFLLIIVVFFNNLNFFVQFLHWHLSETLANMFELNQFTMVVLIRSLLGQDDHRLLALETFHKAEMTPMSKIDLDFVVFQEGCLREPFSQENMFLVLNDLEDFWLEEILKHRDHVSIFFVLFHKGKDISKLSFGGLKHATKTNNHYTFMSIQELLKLCINLFLFVSHISYKRVDIFWIWREGNRVWNAFHSIVESEVILGQVIKLVSILWLDVLVEPHIVEVWHNRLKEHLDQIVEESVSVRFYSLLEGGHWLQSKYIRSYLVAFSGVLGMAATIVNVESLSRSTN